MGLVAAYSLASDSLVLSGTRGSVLLLIGPLALAFSRLVLLLTVGGGALDLDLGLDALNVSASVTGCSHEDVGVGFAQLVKHLLAVL